MSPCPASRTLSGGDTCDTAEALATCLPYAVTDSFGFAFSLLRPQQSCSICGPDEQVLQKGVKFLGKPNHRQCCMSPAKEGWLVAEIMSQAA